ncbi:cardiac-enriched FHL2-interacting protein [Corvus moneduloides]|uniref:cardiac-enriched FHL2-interacting protein n=1 Tax=Corvus moneduloides TaxID=1196302 RepID=UPI001361FD95|nr:cardiac-enriched FHL2-interacting protein [Corvus moneduloides]XP_031972496.1 cardiac-enriched FHL2-interacting protein [Corvus moneduloides]XP_031972497.1 cardiac-enriched FHL2-interacting protein [Corvus moneduloides]XP_031972498.1 cardiac-enriched FHL2-interacting protein [Corvus moneduloides]
MQGNKKHTEGHSDSSSIGSLLDDADREVSSLTDRAFKSLCVAELEDPYNEPELSISPDFALQLSAKIHSGTLNHDMKNSNICDKLTARNNEHTIWASTFQQLPKCAPEEKRIAKNNTFAMGGKLYLPVPGPRNNKHVSKVSSLIKTFDKTADQGSGSSLIANKQPIKNSFQKYKMNRGNDIASCDDTDILSIHKELSEFSEANQGSLSGKHEPQRRPNKVDLSYRDSDGYYPVLIERSKIAKSNFSHSSKKALKNRNLKVNEPAKKGNFLHSENSAFESWNVHHKKLTEKEEFVDIKMKKEGLEYVEESPLVKGSHTHEHKLSPATTTVAKKKEKDFQMKPTPPEAAFPLPAVPQGPVPSETKFPAAFPPTPPPRNHVHQGPLRPPPAPPALPLPPPTRPGHPSTPPTPEAPPVPPLPIPAPLSPTALSQVSVSPQSVSYRMVSPSLMFETPSPPPPKPQATLTEEESLNPQLGNTCPPWRRQRATERAAGKRQAAKEKFTDSHKTSLSEKATGADPDMDMTPVAKQANSPGSISPSFNITELLTPVIPPKQEVDTVESELIPLTPPPTESTASRDHEESTLDDYRSWDSYRLTASSLLFNLKDVRKRVKSIYTPSPLLRALEEKNKTRKNMQDTTKINASLSTLHDKSEKNITEKDELSDIASVLSSSVREKDSKTDLTEHFTDNCLTLSSPQTTEDLPFYQTEDSLQQDNSKHQDLVKNTRDNENFPLFRHESSEPDSGKHLQYPAQRPFSRHNVDTTAGQPMQNRSEQGEEHERQASVQNENFAFKTLLNQLSPEEDVPYSSSQTSIVVPGHEARGKRSTSSSEQSFVSTVEQPLQEEPFLPVPLMQQTCLQESQRTDSEMESGSKKIHKERGKGVGEDELQYYACISPSTGAAEKREGSVTGNEQRSLVKEKLGREKREEANSTNSASDSIRDMSVPRSEEPQTPSSSSSTKPSLFMIKDNTFRSPQVIRAVKLPLLRSFSLDDTVSSSYKEMERKFMSPAVYKQHQNMLHAQEAGWWASRHRGQQNVRDGATDREKEASEPGSTSVALDPSLLEDTESFSFGKLTEEDETACALLNKFGQMNEESVCRSKKKPTKARHSLTQPIIGLENDQAQNNPSYPAKRKTNYFKNHHLSNRKGGSCAKKIITRETISPVTGSMLEDHTCSSVSNDTLENILHTEGAPVLLDNLSCSAVTSPRSGGMMHALAASSLSDKPTISSLREREDVTNPALLNVTLEKQAYMPAEEMIDSAQRNLLSDIAGEAGRLEPRGLGGRPAGKPPTVPPKTEKALRRAKKLANRRKKVQEQQKNPQTEHTDAVGRKPTHSGETIVSDSPLGYSPLHPPLHSTFTPTETSTGKPRLAPAMSPSSSSTQRKLLQDPDSGQYYVVDLPAEVNLKTFYDPETGKYVQVSVPSLEQNLHQSTSSEIKNSPYASYPRVLPLPASSVAVLKSPSQLSEPAWSVPAGPEPAELPEDAQQDYRYTESVDTQPYAEPASYSYHQNARETQVHLGKDVSPTQNTGIVTLTSLDDFAAEGVS